ncbi:hypothetical protein ACIPEN_09585 [Herbaspirillum chlorophenolicum]|uniref:Uncharacterized protein n=1 Tax=Herbaspirillum chlorophenolicum TaxID=211589 RepID=A0ABW8EYQ3_9BURK
MAHFHPGNLTSAYPDRYQITDNDHAHTSVDTRQPPPPIAHKPLPAQQQAIARRERSNFIHQMQREQAGEDQQRSHVFNNQGVPRVVYGVTSAPAGDRDELHFWSPDPAPPQLPPKGASLSKEAATMASAFPMETKPTYVHSDPGKLPSSTALSQTKHATSLASVRNSTPEATAAAIEQLLRTGHVGIAALKAPKPEFMAGTRHLTATSQQGLAAQLGDLKSLRKQLAGYQEGLDLNPQLVDAMQARGLQVADAEQQIEDLINRCNERSDAIAALRAHDTVEVSSHPIAGWLAQQMMESEQTRDALNHYLQDTTPLELQVRRNELVKLRGELSRVITDRERNGMEQQALQRNIALLHASIASLEHAFALPPGSTFQAGYKIPAQLLAKHEDLKLAQDRMQQLAAQADRQWQARQQLTKRVDALPGQIAMLESRVAPAHIPTGETATDMTTDAVARYLSRKYEPIRPHLHTLRDELDRLLPEDGVATPERRQLVKLRKQIEQTLEAADKAEYAYIARTLEQAHANGAAPQIAYSPQAAKSLSTRMAHYDSHSAVRREPTELTQARIYYGECKEMHRQAYERQREAKKNSIEQGTPIDSSLISRTKESKKTMAQAEASYLALQAIEDRELPILQRTARHNRELKQLSEQTLYAMLDEKLTFFQQQGYASLAAVPPPKPAINDMDYLAQRYHVRLSELAQDPEQNRQHIAALKNKMAFLAPTLV